MNLVRLLACAFLVATFPGCQRSGPTTIVDPAEADLDAPVPAKTLKPRMANVEYHKDYNKVNRDYTRIGGQLVAGSRKSWALDDPVIVLPNRVDGGKFVDLPPVPFAFRLVLDGQYLAHINLPSFTSLTNMTSLKLRLMDVRGNKLKPLEQLPNLAEIEFFSCEVDADTFRTLAQFPQLRELKCGWMPPGFSEPKHFKQLRRLPHLTTLTLSRELATPEGLAQLKPHPGLRNLSIVLDKSNQRETFQAVSQLTNLTELELRFYGSELATSELQLLKPLTNLKRLRIDSLQMTDEFYDMLVDFPQLTHLRFGAETLSVNEIKRLAAMPKLEHLHVSTPKAITDTDAVMKELAKLPSLNRLALSLGSNSTQALTEFKAAKPNCVVTGS